MNRVVRTFDPHIVKAVMLHPSVWTRVQDDEPICPATWEPVFHPSIIYLAAFDDSELLGLFLLKKDNAATVQGHLAFLPNAYGRTVDPLRLAIEWVWANTGFKRITAGIPRCNGLARRVVERAGMTRFGTNPGAWLKHGLLHDVDLYGISRGVNHG